MRTYDKDTLLQSPLTFQADAILRDRGIHVVPDIVANGGGVTVSFFEWVSIPSRLHWLACQQFLDLERTFVTHRSPSERGSLLLKGEISISTAVSRPFGRLRWTVNCRSKTCNNCRGRSMR